MDLSRKANREGQERTLQYQTKNEGLLEEELNQGKLAQLLAFIDQLARTPPGIDELQRRTKNFGACQRQEGETSGQFYGRLRHWLDRTIPQTKSPRHAPRQTDD